MPADQLRSAIAAGSTTSLLQRFIEPDEIAAPGGVPGRPALLGHQRRCTASRRRSPHHDPPLSQGRAVSDPHPSWRRSPRSGGSTAATTRGHRHGRRRRPQPDEVPGQDDEHQAGPHQGEVPPLTPAQSLTLRPAYAGDRGALASPHPSTFAPRRAPQQWAGSEPVETGRFLGRRCRIRVGHPDVLRAAASVRTHPTPEETPMKYMLLLRHEPPTPARPRALPSSTPRWPSGAR